MVVEEPSYSSGWSWEQDKAFENALATVPEDAGDRWERIASAVTGKSVEDIKNHYEILVEDLDSIVSGRVTLPSYIPSENSGEPASEGGSGGGSKKGKNSSGHSHGESNQSGKASRSDQERRKGIAWTEEEHRLFLLGLEKYGKGDWRSISRNFVITRTPTQVASHAQKYFIRMNSMNKDRRRSSIHDITSVPGGGGDVSSTKVLITGQAANLPAVVSSGKPAKPSSSKLPGPPLHGLPGVGIYGGTTIGQPVVGGPLVSAVGTPINLLAPTPYMAYGVRAPVAAAGAVVPGAPMSFPPMNCPSPRASAHQ